MKKIIAMMLILCLAAGICGCAAAEADRKVLDFPKSGFTFAVPDYVESMAGGIFSISDPGETEYQSGILFAFALYLPRTGEETAAMNDLLASCPSVDELSEEVQQAVADFLAPRTELFIITALSDGRTWENDVLPLEGTEKLRDPVKIGECGGFTYYLSVLKPEEISARMELVSRETSEAFIDATDRIMEQPELFTLKERDMSRQTPEPGTQVDFEAADLDGNPVTRADLTAGSKVTVITFWQTFCGPCMAEMPELDRLAREYGDRGLNVIGCVCDAVTEKTLQLAKEISGEHIFRNVKLTRSMDQALPADGTPASYFLDGDGRVLDYMVAGTIPEDYIAALEDYLNGKTDEFQALIRQKAEGNETAAQTDEEQTYTVIFVDQNGEPVPEVTAAFCTPERCSYTVSDEEGKCVYKGEAYAYHVTVVEVPDGYSEDFSDDIYTGKYSCSMTIVIEKE